MANVVNELFNNATLRRLLFRGRFLLVLALLFPFAWSAHLARLPWAFAISMAGQLIQTWCFASLVKNRELTVRGPYLICRNPMYIGRYFMILGFVALIGARVTMLWIIAVYTVLYYLYMANRVRREERRLARVFGEAYARYCERVPRFRPTLRHLTDGNLRYWDWAPFLENHAQWNIVATLLVYAAVFAIHRIVPVPWR